MLSPFFLFSLLFLYSKYRILHFSNEIKFIVGMLFTGFLRVVILILFAACPQYFIIN